jgi:hypothetical protein
MWKVKRQRASGSASNRPGLNGEHDHRPAEPHGGDAGTVSMAGRLLAVRAARLAGTGVAAAGP